MDPFVVFYMYLLKFVECRKGLSNIFEKNPSHTAARNVKKRTMRGPFAEASRIPGCRKISLVDLSQGVVGIHIGFMYGMFTYIYHKHLDSRYQMYVGI